MARDISPEVARAAGVIGLGAMGAPMARHMAQAGFRVSGYDPDVAAWRRVADTVTCLASPAAVAASAALTLVVVPTDTDVVAACAGDDGLFAADGTGRIVAICSSVRPDTVRELEEPAGRAGFDLLDLPLTKGVRAAEAGTMTLLAGGDPGVLQRARPFLDCFANTIHHVGGLGAGQVAKTVNNLLLWSGLVAVAEALRLAARLGTDPAVLREAMRDCSADSWVLREFDRIVPTWPAKDMEIALAVAATAGIDLPLMATVATQVGSYDRNVLNRILAGEHGD